MGLDQESVCGAHQWALDTDVFVDVPEGLQVAPSVEPRHLPGDTAQVVHERSHVMETQGRSCLLRDRDHQAGPFQSLNGRRQVPRGGAVRCGQTQGVVDLRAVLVAHLLGQEATGAGASTGFPRRWAVGVVPRTRLKAALSAKAVE